MSDETREDHESGEPTSRRRFLQGATGMAAASVAALVTPEAWVQAQTPQQPATDLSEACCMNASATPLMAAALLQGSYIGLAASNAGPGLFALNVGQDRQVSLGSRLAVNLPQGFIVSSLGLARGQLALTGGLPFLLDSYEVDDELSEDVRAAMEVIPEGMPTSGKRRIEVMGVHPAVLLLDPPSASVEMLELPTLPKRTFAVATGIAETASGTLTLMIEHSDGVNESYYASAIDMLEQSLNGEWMTDRVAYQLGESGPNHLAVSGDEIVLGLNTSRGAKFLSPKLSPMSLAEAPTVEGRILALVPGNAGFTVLTGTEGGVRQLSLARPGDTSVDSGAVDLKADAVIGAVPVAGAWGQSIVIGRRSARLVDEASGSSVRM